MRKPNRKPCMNCSYTPKNDIGKFMVMFRSHKLRVIMEQTCLNIMTCPKCGNTVVNTDFKPKTQNWITDKRLKAKRKQNSRRLRKLYS